MSSAEDSCGQHEAPPHLRVAGGRRGHVCPGFKRSQSSHAQNKPSGTAPRARAWHRGGGAGPHPRNGETPAEQGRPLARRRALAAVRSATRLAQSPAPRHKTRPTRNDVDAFVRDVLNAPSRDWEPTERLCAVALDAHARDGDVKATRQLIRAARSLGGVQPGPVSFCILIKAVGRRGEKLPSGREKRTLTKSVDEAIKGCARNSVPDAVLLNAAGRRLRATRRGRRRFALSRLLRGLRRAGRRARLQRRPQSVS